MSNTILKIAIRMHITSPLNLYLRISLEARFYIKILINCKIFKTIT